jgi:hypothetical protein
MILKRLFFSFQSNKYNREDKNQFQYWNDAKDLYCNAFVSKDLL